MNSANYAGPAFGDIEILGSPCRNENNDGKVLDGRNDHYFQCYTMYQLQILWTLCINDKYHYSVSLCINDRYHYRVSLCINNRYYEHNVPTATMLFSTFPRWNRSPVADLCPFSLHWTLTHRYFPTWKTSKSGVSAWKRI